MLHIYNNVQHLYNTNTITPTTHIQHVYNMYSTSIHQHNYNNKIIQHKYNIIHNIYTTRFQQLCGIYSTYTHHYVYNNIYIRKHLHNNVSTTHMYTTILGNLKYNTYNKYTPQLQLKNKIYTTSIIFQHVFNIRTIYIQHIYNNINENPYITSIRYIFNMCSKCVQQHRFNNFYTTTSIQYLYNKSSTFIQHIYKICTTPTQFLHNIYTTPLHHIYNNMSTITSIQNTTCIQCVCNYIYTTHTQNIYNNLFTTAFTQHVFKTPTTSTV